MYTHNLQTSKKAKKENGTQKKILKKKENWTKNRKMYNGCVL